MVSVRGWGQKAQDNESFFKVTLLILAIEGQNNESYRGGWTFKKKNSQPRGGEGGVWREWDGFPLFTEFEL